MPHYKKKRSRKVEPAKVEANIGDKVGVSPPTKKCRVKVPQPEKETSV